MVSRKGLAFAGSLCLGAPLALVLSSRGQALASPEGNAPLSSAFEWNDVKPEPTKVGAVRRFFKRPTATEGELACHVTTLNPGEAAHPPHRHPEEEMIIVKEGTVESFQEGQTRRLGPGSVIFQASGELHGVRNVGDGPASYYVIKWSANSAKKPNP